MATCQDPDDAILSDALEQCYKIFEEEKNNKMNFARSVYRVPWKLHQEYDLPFCQCAHRCNIGNQKILS